MGTKSGPCVYLRNPPNVVLAMKTGFTHSKPLTFGTTDSIDLQLFFCIGFITKMIEFEGNYDRTAHIPDLA